MNITRKNYRIHHKYLSMLLLLTACFTAAVSFTYCGGGKQYAAIDEFIPAGAESLRSGLYVDGAEAFRAYSNAVAEAARSHGAADIANGIGALSREGKVPADKMKLASRLLRGYTTAMYGDSIVSDLQRMIVFRTFAEPGRENWDAPEFVRQGEWLKKKAEGLGFTYEGYDGRVGEITMKGAGHTLAILTHGDVQSAEGQEWSSPPWEGRIVGGRLIGRGSEDDKGPIIVTLYAFKALKDAGWQLNSTLKLLVANGEESSWEEIRYYLMRADIPDITIGIDAAYPVTSAQKAFGIITITAGEEENDGGRWSVVSVSGGVGLSIIPERGKARLKAVETDADIRELQTALTGWLDNHPDADINLEEDGDEITVTALGKGGHSSVPASGHNALGDLASFLSTLELERNGWGTLAYFLGKYVGEETDGASLGIAQTDDFMGSLTSSLAIIHEEEGAAQALINIRVPRGISTEKITAEVEARAEEFSTEGKGSVSARVQVFGAPHVVPAESRLVSTLLEVWEEVTGEKGEPFAVGGGTQARLFPGAVDFGPSFDFAHYRGHAPDEYLTVEELKTMTELTVAALWYLAGD